MGLFNFLLGAGAVPAAFASPTNIVPSIMQQQQQMPPKTRRDAAMIANDLPNQVVPQVPPVQQSAAPVAPQAPQAPVTPPPPPSELPDGLFRYQSPYDHLLPKVEDLDPGAIGRGLETRSWADVFDGTNYRQKKMLERLDLIQKLQSIDKGFKQEIGGNTGILYDWNKPLEADNPAWANLDHLYGIQSKYARGGKSKQGAEYAQTFTDPQTNRTYYGWLEQDENGNATIRARGMDNEAPPPDVAARLIPGAIANTLTKGDVTFTNKQVEEIVNQADAAYKSRAALQTMRETFQGAAATGFGGDAQRWFMEQMGIDIGSLNVTDKQSFEAASRMLEGQLTRQILGGQGQITEGERKIIRDMLPTLRTTPQAFEKIMAIYEKANERAIIIDNAWSAYKSRLGQDADFNTFRRAMNLARGSDDPNAMNELMNWAENGDIRRLPPGITSPRRPRNAPGYSDVPVEPPSTLQPAQPQSQPQQAPPANPAASGAPLGPNGQRYKWSTKAPVSPFMYGVNPGAYPGQAPAPQPQPSTQFVPGQPAPWAPGATPPMGGPEGIGPAPRGMTWAPRFEGDPETSVYDVPVQPSRSQNSLLNTPSSRLVEASRSTQRGQDFARTAGEAKEIAQLIKSLPKMTPSQRAAAEAKLRQMGVIR